MAPRAQILRSLRTVAPDGRRAPRAAALSLLALAFAESALGAVAADAPTATTPPAARPDDSGTVEDGLRQVLDDALAANLELRAGTASVQQRFAALEQARARYLPVLDFDARYSVANGGRTIDFPVGDLLNPVYETLDELLVQSGQPAAFPRVKNEEIRLLLQQEQNTRFVVAQPIYEPRLGPSVEASRQDVNRAEANLAGLRTRVVRDTKQAYYEWLAAQQQSLVLDATREVAAANLAANESLYRNGRVTRDFVFRAEADLLEIEQQQLAVASRVQDRAELREPAAQRAAVVTGACRDDRRGHRRTLPHTTRPAVAGRVMDVPALQRVATEQRAELQSLDAAIAGSEAQQDLARAAFKPTLALGAEAGIQGEDYGFGHDDRYVLASVVLRWNAFRGGADQAALAEARALTEELRATRDLATQQVQLEVQRALETLEVAESSLGTARKRSEAAEAAFRITARKRDLGQINQADFIDARRTQTDAQLNLNRVRAEFLARLAELEFAIGGTRAAGKELL